MSAQAGHHDDHHEHVVVRPENWPHEVAVGKASAGKVGMWIFLLSDALMFGGFLLAYGILRGASDVWWQPGEPDLGINFTAGLTFLLICSSVSMVLSLQALKEKDRKNLLFWLGLTVLGGALFLCGQMQEYFGIFHGHGLIAEGLVFGHSHRATTFYLVTSFHGMHVFSGVSLLSVMWIRCWLGKYDDGNENHLEIVGLFWHFVDLVWIIVFTLIYLIPTT